jgi:hypothetical protein
VLNDDSESSDSSLPSSNFEESDEESEEEKGEDENEKRPRKIGYKKVKVYKHILDRDIRAPQPRNASMNANVFRNKSKQKKS